MNYANNRRDYIAAWKIVLMGLLGWDEEAVEKWARHWDTCLDTGKGGFYHEAPGYYIADLLLEKYCKVAASRSSLRYQRNFNKIADYIDFINGKCMWDYCETEVTSIGEFLSHLE